MVNGDIIIDDTGLAREYCVTLDSGVQYYNNLVTELRTARENIITNWDGDAAAYHDVISRIDQITSIIDASLIPAMSGLSTSIVNLANETDKVSSNTVQTGGTTNGGTQVSAGGDGSAPTTDAGVTNDTSATSKPGFWEWHGGNFAEAWTSQNWSEAWDYSGCDSGLDYVTTTADALLDTTGNVLDALLDTAGAIDNFLLDGAFEIIGWLF